MKFHATPIKDLYVAETQKISGERGNFMRIFCDKEIPHFTVKQANYSDTPHKGTVRGLHFQRHPALEAKMVRCIQGKIHDVAVDLRAGSSTFLKHFAVELSGENNLALIIPAGFAHGFQALENDCKMIYLHSAAYTPEHEGGLPYNDPVLAIGWPLPATNLSERDRSFAPVSPDFKGLDHAM